MADAGALALALAALAATLTVAVVRPQRVPEAAAAVLGALILLATGAISLSQAEATLRDLGGTVAFLAALLLLAEGCRREGLFVALGGLMAARAGADPRRLLALVFAVATAVTVVLGLDATVVLLPPIVLATARRVRSDPHTPLYACAHLANSASLLLPISNLTNLLAFRASGLSFTHFALLMALPTVAVVAVAWIVLSRRPPGAVRDQRDSGRASARGRGSPASRPLSRLPRSPASRSPCLRSPWSASRSARRFTSHPCGSRSLEPCCSICRGCATAAAQRRRRCSPPSSRAF